MALFVLHIERSEGKTLKSWELLSKEFYLNTFFSHLRPLTNSITEHKSIPGIINNNWKLFCSELASITRLFIFQNDLKKRENV